MSTEWEARQAAERAAEKVRATQFASTAAAVAAELSKLEGVAYTFVAGEYENSVRPFGQLVSEGLALHLAQFRDGYTAKAKERIEVSGAWPREKHGAYASLRSYGVIGYNEPEPKITVSADGSPERIAKDIKRRLIDANELRAKYAKVLEAIETGEAYKNRQKKLTAELFAAAGEAPRRDDDSTIRLYDYAPGVSYGDIRVVGDNTAKIDVTVSGELAKAFIEFLIKARNK